jgi:hypothetical protein
MWTRGKDTERPGMFAYELFTADGALIERVGGFATHIEADRAAERAQRMALDFPGMTPPIENMTDAELLAALEE